VSLLGLPFLLLVLGVTALVLAACATLWNRWPRPVLWPARVTSLILVMAVGAALAATVANRSFGFYTTTGELLGASALTYQPPNSFQVGRAGSVTVQVEDPDWYRTGSAAAASGRGSMFAVLLPGGLSRLSRHGFVYLPAAWFLDRGTSLPLIEMFHGYPGSPGNFRVQLDIASLLDREIAARRMPPAVTVFPNTYEQGRASECVDAVHGQRVETYLAVDVPNDMTAAFDTLPGRAVGLLGYSEGGFCAVNLGLHHPDRVAAAVSLSGYFTAGTDRGTKSLYRGVRGALLRNSPTWWVRHRAPTGPALLVVSGGGDRDSRKQDRALAGVARQYAPRLTLISALVPGGGHNFATFTSAIPAALDFLGEHLPAPLAAPLRLPLDPTGTSPIRPTAAPSRLPSPVPSSSLGTYGPSASPSPATVGPRPSRRPSPRASANPTPS
jgi:pimeloyl-ACP methyl ester carboxylesterase